MISICEVLFRNVSLAHQETCLFITLHDTAVEVYYNCHERDRIIMSLVQGNCLTVFLSFSFRGE